MPVEEFVAGWISGALGLVLGHPFDTVKVRLQTQTTYRGIIDCMVKTYHHESLLGFFKGMSFPIASIAMVNSVLFGVYSNTLLALTATAHQERRAQPPSYIHVFIAGCTRGFVQHLSIQLLTDGVEEDAASRHQGESQLIGGREHRGGGTLAWLPSTPQPGAFRHPLFDIALTLLTYFTGQRARTKDRTRRLAGELMIHETPKGPGFSPAPSCAGHMPAYFPSPEICTPQKQGRELRPQASSRPRKAQLLSHPPLLLFRKQNRGAWVAQSVKRPTSAQVTILQFVSSSPGSGSVLTAQSLEPALDSVSLSLCSSPAHALSLNNK
ncbi:solute carrier family 25 member 45 isoform X1 [Panthera pardus]|uniref:Solute carrier family 25 member 45 isoform X1 n=1 Tax=Panthera pardus TaxID=9691 RepID=A0A9W2V9V1_PANPR|nr:solute carrier family 25 member 45 isoform X1 [Panthera pardus]